MIKDFMKAFALAFMFLIGMISFTGFGNTTADLAKNSETEMATMATPVSVGVEVPVMVQKFEAFEIVASENDSFTIYENEPFLSNPKASLIATSLYYDGGGGLNYDGKEIPIEAENYRSPRDGISQVLPSNIN